MIYNHERKAVWEWDSGECYCPECRRTLISRKGETVCWHWAHKADLSKQCDCPHEESAWHLAMKFAYMTFPGWEIEVPVTANYRKYRIDAMNISTGSAREFIHSLSPHYSQKHIDLKLQNLNVLWIFDGKVFGSKRIRRVSRGGVKHLLTPRAMDLQYRIKALVHNEGQLWREWQENVWFPCEGHAAQEILKRLVLETTHH
jgi:hypothetical protein